MSKEIGFSHANITRNVPDLPGIYRFYLRKICLYVGSTKRQTLKSRLLQHWKRTHNRRLSLWIACFGKTISVTYEVIEDKNLRTIREQDEIDRLSPMTNEIRARAA
jgi:excinuclease UvrABC nuclease subunit